MGLSLKSVIRVDINIGSTSIKTDSYGLANGFEAFKSTFKKITINSMVIDFKEPTKDLAHKMKEYIVSEEWRLEDNIVDAKRAQAEAQDTFERRDSAFGDIKNTLITEGDVERARENLKQKNNEQWFAEYWLNEYKAKADQIHANLGTLLITSEATSTGFLNEYRTGVHNLQLDDEKVQDQQILDGVELAWDELGDSTMFRLRNRVANNFEKLWSGGSF